MPPPPAEQLIFLPGASGDIHLWEPLAQRLQHTGTRRYISWPGFGGAPRDPAIHGIIDLVALVTAQLNNPTNLFAQSMGGVVAILATLQRPALVKRLVLTVTSGGINMSALGAIDWRPVRRAGDPHAPEWFDNDRTDVTERLPTIQCPVLLLWGDNDPISPVAAGQLLSQLLPNAELIVVPGGTHTLVEERVDDILPHVERHLAKPVSE